MKKDKEVTKKSAMDLSDEEMEEMLDKAEEEQREAELKRKKKKNRQDVLTIFMILAVFVLTIIFASWLTSNPELIKEPGGGNISQEEYEEAKRISRIVAMGVTIVALGIVALFLRSMIKRKRKEALMISEEQRKIQEIEAARARVKQARMDEFLNAGMSELEKRRAMRKYSLDEKRDNDKYVDNSRYLDDFDEETEEYARRVAARRGKKIGDYLDEDEMRERRFQDGKIPPKQENETVWDKIKSFFRKIFRR